MTSPVRRSSRRCSRAQVSWREPVLSNQGRTKELAAPYERVAADGPWRGDSGWCARLQIAPQIRCLSPLSRHRTDGLVADAATVRQELAARHWRVIAA